ncbi:hypothetical protein M1583_02025 [Candidatus Marsarchaeota archaeon]|nr:hypothetical protein [Candidatus Marsarchaeota archaeon]
MINLNLFNPTNVDFITAVLLSYILGLVHGITPDEHTWPITFSYAVGSYSSRQGMKAGFIFSSGFTLQRALVSELAYFALVGILTTSLVFGITYIFVGLAMFLAGVYIKEKGVYLHWHWIEAKLGTLTGLHKEHSKEQELEFEHKKNPITSDDEGIGLKRVPSRLAFLHGLIAGFGFGAFALIIYTVLSPSMPSPWLGWLPGALFGLGTMTMQVIFGAAFGKWITKVKKLTKKGIAFIARTISSDVLFYGGLTFVVAGALIEVFPQILTYGIITPLKIHNLHDLGVGFFIVIAVVVIIGAVSYKLAVKKAIKLGYTYA